jgi:hypothetical protein
MGAQTWMTGLILYFVGIAVVVSLFSIAGAFSDGNVQVTNFYDAQLKGSVNESIEVPSKSFKWSGFFADVFSFFVFNVSFTDNSVLIEYLWLIRIIFVYLPLTLLVITFYYSLPTIGG